MKHKIGYAFMERILSIFIIFISGVLLWSFNPSSVKAQQEAEEFYKKGKQAAEQGQVQKALDIWLQARGALQVPSTRIGNAFAELVAKENRQDYYEFGTLMYQWGLSAETIEPNKEVLRNEIERVGLLATDKVYRRWIGLWKDNDPQLYQELLSFWEQQDPTPTTTYNERLIEHWQRIAYSKEHFTNNKSGPLSADDRARIYVRYGAPDQIKEGQFLFDAAAARSYITDIANTPIGCEATGNQIRIMVQHVQNYHQNPRYEVWIYRQPSNTTNNIYIFGNATGASSFEQVDTIGDFIPNKAFSMGKNIVPSPFLSPEVNASPCLLNIRPGLILQLMYYDALSTVDIFFGQTFNSIMGRAVNSSGSPVSLSLAKDIRSTTEVELFERNMRAPRQQSTAIKRMVDIPLQIYQYRLLNEQSEPYLATFVESKPRQAFLLDYMQNYNEKDTTLNRKQINNSPQLQNYTLTHALKLYNEDNDLEGQISDEVTITIGRTSSSASLFFVPAMADATRQVFSAMLENSDPESSYSFKETVFPNQLRGLGKTTVIQPEPLEYKEGELQMGELIVGYNYNNAAPADHPFPFTVANRKEIPQNEDLVIHLEIYNMSQGEEGNYNTRLSYQVEPKGGILDRFKKQRENLTLTLNLESATSRYIENLQVKTRELRPGTYNMQITVQDPGRNQQVERNFEFEVIETNLE